MKLAVIGCGDMGERYARRLIAMKDVELVGVCDKAPGRAESLGDKLGVDSYRDYWDVFGEIDAAVVATNAQSHFEVCLDVIGANSHVLVEKPFVTRMEDAVMLIHDAELNDVVIQVGHIERFNPVFGLIRKNVTYPFQIEAQRFSPVSFRRFDIDVVLDLMIHDIDMVLTLAKTDVSRVTGSGSRDRAVAKLTFIDGSEAVLRADRKAKTRSRVWTLGGDKYYLIGEHDCLTDQLQHFLDCIQQGRKPDVDGQQGTRALEVALEISRQVRGEDG